MKLCYLSGAAARVAGAEPESATKGGENMSRIRRQTGQGLVEYALILIFVAIVVIAALMALGPFVGNLFSQVIAGL
jgi:pilus assembly protein Flp/PilA